jgi:transcriptional regulator with XRE-family HTH domain
MEQHSKKTPFRPLGRRLKELRARVNESLAEASGAVEIDVRLLASYELGQALPTEEVLLLLISHFGAKEDEAVKLWELAGYGIGKVQNTHMTNENSVSAHVAELSNSKILFTDIVDIAVNNYGVVMNFMQSGGVGAKPIAVAKVGMSREHAKSVLEILQVTLAQTENIVPKLPKRIDNASNKKSDEKSLS